jgi:hypothetical protein
MPPMVVVVVPVVPPVVPVAVRWVRSGRPVC